MAGQKRKGLLPRRRRHDDEGEEDGSTAGDVAEYASTAGSMTTDAEEDGDVSNVSADEEAAPSVAAPPELVKKDVPSIEEPKFKTTLDTEAMLNGLKVKDDEETEVLHYDDLFRDSDPGRKKPVNGRQQVQRTRSQPNEQTKQRVPSQPNIPPPQKGYFMHDDRSRDRLQQQAIRGRGRGFVAPSGRGFGPQAQGPSRWTHDLHETVNQPAPPQQTKQPPPPAAAPTGPNRTFSTTTVLGNVPVTISIPGAEKKTNASMVKKHYTLLPQHRPPLRRDKPVRISIPDEMPRYIFPSTERSFIFIPRAMRPNQQQYRGRGRGSFHASRRTSMYSYTPSIGMSRRPSIALSNTGSGIHTPAGPPTQYQQGFIRPVVRMPMPGGQPFFPAAQNTEVFLGDNAAIIHSPPATLPMHQPIPQKTLSIDNIESPARAPQQQLQLPFHQQVPPNLADQTPKMPHIPEGAIYAQPFQPYPAYPQAGFYGGPYNGSMMMQPETYSVGVGGPVLPMQQNPASTGQQQPQQPYEANGTMYYYDPSQQYMAPPMVMQTPYFYPSMQNQMFYQ